jgi:hypothetical protein
MYRLLVEAISVGILNVVVGNLVGWSIGKFVDSDLPRICKDWNKFYVMEISLFLTGITIHLICEFSGLNKWYCKNGNACQN